MPFMFLTNEKIEQSKIIGFTLGYEEGTNNPEGKRDWSLWIGGQLIPIPLEISEN